jgi:hypothetical protein
LMILQRMQSSTIFLLSLWAIGSGETVKPGQIGKMF